MSQLNSLVAVGDDRIRVWEYGHPDGHPVMVFHGVPTCGAGFAWADEGARVRGLRLVAPDRPGIGGVTTRSGWSVGDYPGMVDALADVLGIERYAVWGYSGGGPYAAASVAASGRVTAAAICAGMGELTDGWAAIGDFEKTDAQMLELAVRHPLIARLLLRVAVLGARVSPGGAAKSFGKQLSPSDRAVLASWEPREAMRLFTEAFSRGSRGVVADYAALGRPWGIEFGPTRIPVSIWHGSDDPMVPVAHSTVLAERLGTEEVVVFPGEGHLATITHAGEILDWLAGTTP